MVRCVVAGRRASRTLLILVIGAAGACLGLALTGSAGAGTGASVGAGAETTEQSFPLAVRQASVHKLRGRIVGRATIVNTGNAPVRSTTGVLGVRRGSGGKPTGVLTFSVPSLPPRGSKGVELKTGLVSAFPVGSGTYTVLICTDIYSQIQRFAQNRNCSAGDRQSISARALPRSSGPVPTTIVRTGLATVGRSSTAVFRFVSAVARRGFQCSLDGGPWLACRSPQRYRALVGGAHGFDVRATSVSGTDDGAQAHRSWAVGKVRPAVTLRRPVSGSTTHNTKPAFSGTAGSMPGDSSKIRVKLFPGSGASGSPLRTLVARVSGGSWSVAPTKSLARGTYTAQAEQSNRAGNTGVSRPHAFTIDTTLPAQVGRFLGIGAATAAAPKTYSIGGTVSGLSGTVVLQDNGSDNLSVSRNGAFTFAKKLPAGAAYNVTVKSNPAGQACTVAGGSGTVGSANVTSVAVTCTNSTTTSASDDFNRASGGLGASWVAMSDGGLSIASQQVVGTAATHAGDVRAGESYGSDQYSQIEVTSTQLTGGQWIGPTVRSQNGGQGTYLGIYFWNNGTPQLRLYKRTAGTFTQLGSSYGSEPLPAGTKLTLSAQGSTIAFQQNGTTRISVTDTTLTGGTPGIMTYDTGTADNWTGGTGSPPPLTTYSIGGTVSGLSGTVVLQDNGGDDLSVSANGAVTFATKLPTGAAYNVTVKTNPAGQTCTVAGGSGTVGSANVTNVAVTCTTNMYSIGGSVSGLSGTVVLQDNGGDDLSVSANGAVTFATELRPARLTT